MTKPSVSRRRKHSHEAHDHSISADADRTTLWVALIVLSVFMVAEVIVSLLTGPSHCCRMPGTCCPTSERSG